MNLELSIVIPSHGGHARLPATLAALAQASVPPGGAEVILVDDGSAPALDSAATTVGGLPLRVLRHTPNRGRAAACNRGVDAGRGRVVLILDDDMSVAPNVLVGHSAAHPHGAPPHGVIARIDPDPDAYRGRFGRFLASEDARRLARLKLAAVDVPFSDCLTGHFSIPRAALLGAGGYSENFSRYGFEDIELAYRLERLGITLCYRDDLHARHVSAAVSWRTHCLRHLESGAMACVFAAAYDDPRVHRFLRVDGMSGDGETNHFRRWLARTHSISRALPAPLAPAVLASARAFVRLLEWCAPDRLLHPAYHIVRDMHYARGSIDGRSVATRS